MRNRTGEELFSLELDEAGWELDSDNVLLRTACQELNQLYKILSFNVLLQFCNGPSFSQHAILGEFTQSRASRSTTIGRIHLTAPTGKGVEMRSPQTRGRRLRAGRTALFAATFRDSAFRLQLIAVFCRPRRFPGQELDLPDDSR